MCFAKSRLGWHVSIPAVQQPPGYVLMLLHVSIRIGIGKAVLNTYESNICRHINQPPYPVFFSICWIAGRKGRKTSQRYSRIHFASICSRNISPWQLKKRFVGCQGTHALGTVTSKQGGPLSLCSWSYMACLTETLAMPKDPVSCHIVSFHFEWYELGRWSRCIGEHGWRFILGAGTLFLHCLLQFLPNKKYNSTTFYLFLLSIVFSYMFFQTGQ